MNETPEAPQYSFWPLLLALAVLLIAVGVVSILGISMFGLVLLFASVIGWTWENRAGPEEEPND